jgi:uncharacterized protein (TIGR00730 family)
MRRVAGPRGKADRNTSNAHMTDKLPKPSDPQLFSRSRLSGREAWRTFEIMAEFVDATEKLFSVEPAVTIFGSARVKPGEPYYTQTTTLARKLSDAGFSVISGGGPGIMEAANRGAKAGPSPSIGLNIVLPHEQKGNDFQDISCDFQHFFARKVMFVKTSCAFVMMPGGFGTLDELSEVLVLIQTQKMRRLPIILTGGTFWNGMIDWFRDTLLKERMISPGDIELMQVIDDPDAIVAAIFDHYEARGFALSPQEREAVLSL